MHGRRRGKVICRQGAQGPQVLEARSRRRELTGGRHSKEVAFDSADVDANLTILARGWCSDVHLVKDRAAHAVLLAPHLQRDDAPVLRSREEIHGAARILHERDDGHVDGRRGGPLRFGRWQSLRFFALGLAGGIRLMVLVFFDDDGVCQGVKQLSLGALPAAALSHQHSPALLCRRNACSSSALIRVQANALLAVRGLLEASPAVPAAAGSVSQELAARLVARHQPTTAPTLSPSEDLSRLLTREALVGPQLTRRQLARHV